MRVHSFLNLETYINISALFEISLKSSPVPLALLCDALLEPQPPAVYTVRTARVRLRPPQQSWKQFWSCAGGWCCGLVSVKLWVAQGRWLLFSFFKSHMENRHDGPVRARSEVIRDIPTPESFLPLLGPVSVPSRSVHSLASFRFTGWLFTPVLAPSVSEFVH